MILYRTMTYYYNFYVSYFMLAFLMLQKVFHKTLQYLLSQHTFPPQRCTIELYLTVEFGDFLTCWRKHMRLTSKIIQSDAALNNNNKKNMKMHNEACIPCISTSLASHSCISTSNGLMNGEPLIVWALMMWSSSSTCISSTDERIDTPCKTRCWWRMTVVGVLYTSQCIRCELV